MNRELDAVVFDIGNVLLDWNPEYIFRKILPSNIDVQDFFKEIDYFERNYEMDKGIPLEQARKEMIAAFPHYADVFNAYFDRWIESIGGEIAGTTRLLRQLHKIGIPLYSITNFHQDFFEITCKHYDFLKLFNGIVVSGTEGIRKPDQEIYQLLLDRYDLRPERLIFIDDKPENVETSEKLGFHGHVFESAEGLRDRLDTFNLPLAA